MKTDDISLLSNLDNINEKLPFYYPISFKSNYDSNNTDNKIDIEVFCNIYNNYNKNLIKNKKMNYDIKFKENKNDYDYDEYNSEKIIIDTKKHKYKFIPRRRKNTSNNLSENLSLKNNSLNNYTSNIYDNIKNIKYNSIDKSNNNFYIKDFSNHIKKNSSLSTENKEKLKTDLKKYSNNYKNVFIADYLSYIKFESAGSPRLNKVSREILFTFCPFSLTRCTLISASLTIMPSWS